jgi:5-methylcytosine-specific restriction protein A
MADWPYNTAQWKRLRMMKLRASPMCQPCQAAGRITIANTVDHNVAISAGGPAFPALDALTSCCVPCHSAKTARGAEAGAVRTTRALQPRRGCDATGSQLDPAHPWKLLGAAPKKTAAPLRIQLVVNIARSSREKDRG